MKNAAKEKYVHHLDRAESFYLTMQLIGGDPEYSGGGAYTTAIPLLAVHAGISMADALLVFQRGKRGNDPNHRESVRELNGFVLGDARGQCRGVALRMVG